VEWMGEVPEHWDVRPLKAISELQTGLTLGKKYEGHALVSRPYLRVANVQDGFLALDDIAEIALPGPDAARYELRKGDVLLTEGGYFAKLGRGHVWEGEVSGCLHQNHIFAVRPRPEFLSSPFLAHVMASAYGRAYFTATSKQSTNLASTNSTKLRNLPVPMPAGAEQNDIVSFIARASRRIDALVPNKERLLELLQEERAALITRAVTKGLDPNASMKDSGVEWLGEIPAHWEVKRIRNLSAFVTSGSRGWAQYYSDQGSIFLRIGNLTKLSIDLDLSDIQRVQAPPDAEGSRTRVQDQDVLISITALIGAVAVATGVPDAYVSQHLALVRFASKAVSARWIAYCILSRVGQEQLHAQLYGGTKDGLSLEDIRSLIVVLPSLGEQVQLAEMLDRADKRVDALGAKIRQAIDRLKELRTALISAAVTGKIDVRQEVA
jgi:type I restriction enzyme, S subunit